MRRLRVFVAVMAILWSHPNVYAQGPGPGGAGPVKQTVLVGKVVETQDVESVRYTGMVESPARVQVVSRVSGKLLVIGFADGGYVKKGQMLYKIDPIRYKAAVMSAEADVAECQASLDYAQKDYDRNKTLHEKGVVTQDNLENVQSILEIKKANLLAAQANLILAKDDLEDTTIEAPIDGWISVTNYTTGNYITSSSGVLATIIQVDPMRVRFSISNRDFLSAFENTENLKANGQVRLLLADGTDYPLEGKVEFINNEANAKTDSIQVYARFTNPQKKLFAGGTVTVMLSQSQGQMLPAVLPSAVMYDSQGSYVYVVGSGNKVEKRYVVLGSTRTDLQIVKSGVQVGTQVVTDGTHKTMDGAEIEPIYQER